MVTAGGGKAAAGLADAPSIRDRSPATDMGAPGVSRVRMRSVLLAFVLAIVLPVWVFGLAMAWRFSQGERAALEAASEMMARSLAEGADFRLKSLEAALSALAVSPALRADNLERFYQEMTAVARTQRAVIALVSASRQQILNTNAPFGTTLPLANEETPVRAAVETRTAQVSRGFTGNVTPRWLFNITVPIVENGEAARVLVIGMEAAVHLGDVLAIADSPPSWTLAILDSDHRILARRPFSEGAIGQPAHPSIMAVLTPAQSGSGRAHTHDGRPVRTFFHRTRNAPWTMLVGVPESDYDDAFQRTVRPVLFWGLLVMAASLLIAWLLGRRFTDQLGLVAEVARSYRRGERPSPAGSVGIVEIAELQNSLTEAVRERHAHEQELSKLLAEKDLLMQESHHRVNNSLQLVRGILNLQARQADLPATRDALKEAANRILTVAEIHHHLYQGSSTAEANVRRYLAGLMRDLFSSLLPQDTDRAITLESADVVWPSEKVTALGLIAAELVTNAVKYGRGNIAVGFELLESGGSRLVVEDEGPGFDPQVELGVGAGLGSKVITSLVRPDEGEVMIDRSSPHGRVVVTFNPAWRSDMRKR